MGFSAKLISFTGGLRFKQHRQVFGWATLVDEQCSGGHNIIPRGGQMKRPTSDGEVIGNNRPQELPAKMYKQQHGDAIDKHEQSMTDTTLVNRNHHPKLIYMNWHEP